MIHQGSLVGLLVLLVCIIGIVNGAHITKIQHKDAAILESSAAKLTDKQATTATATATTATTTPTKAAVKSSGVTDPLPMPGSNENIVDEGWGAVHLRHRSLSSTSRSKRIAALQAHHREVLAHAATTHRSHNKQTQKSNGKSHVSDTTKKSRRSRHHASRTRALARLAAHQTVAVDASTEVILSNLDDIEYLATVTLGTPPQSFSVIVDTGSTDLWLPSSDCISEGCSGVSTFIWSQSSTFVDLDTNITESYGSGTLEGYLATDTFGIGSLSVVKQTVALIEVEMLDDVSGFGGLMGLAFPSLSDTGEAPVFDNMMLQGLLSENKFSLYLSRDIATDSAIVFGAPQSSLYTGNITYVEVSKQSYWQVTLSDVKVNGVALGLCSGGCQAIVDSGTSLLTSPVASIPTLIAAIGASPDCSNLATLPDIVFVLSDQYGSYEVALSSDNYMLAELSDSNDVECVPGIMAYDIDDIDGTPIWILGDLFFHQYYTIFDRDTPPRMGFATAS